MKPASYRCICCVLCVCFFKTIIIIINNKIVYAYVAPKIIYLDFAHFLGLILCGAVVVDDAYAAVQLCV